MLVIRQLAPFGAWRHWYRRLAQTVFTPVPTASPLTTATDRLKTVGRGQGDATGFRLRVVISAITRAQLTSFRKDSVVGLLQALSPSGRALIERIDQVLNARSRWRWEAPLKRAGRSLQAK